MNRILLLTLLLISFSIQSVYSTIIYVNANVQGGNKNGTSWADAFSDLQGALAIAKYGDSIWVAQGTYYPTSGTNRNISFTLINGVRLFGGFTGAETALEERDWQVNQTILSGDIGVPGDSTDNCYTILYINPCDSTTLVDGLVFLRGNANGGIPSNIFIQPSLAGGAIYIMAKDTSAYPRIYNCVFSDVS